MNGLSLPLPNEMSGRLWADWVLAMLEERYGLKQHGNNPRSWNATLEDGVTIDFSLDEANHAHINAPDSYLNDVRSIATEAHKRTLAQDYGSGAWWKVAFATDMGLSGVTALHFMRIASEHNSRRFQGDWRIGNEALLSFDQAEKGSPPIVFPKFDVQILFRVPSPGHGPHSVAVAEEIATFLRAAASFATAAPLQGAFVPLFPANEDEKGRAEHLLPSVSELPVEGKGLWPQLINLVPEPGLVEGLRRVQGAMFAYEQAIGQASEYVTLALLVSALEALTVPNASWQLKQLSVRFVKFCLTLCPNAISEVMAHQNFRQAFGGYTSQTRFLRSLYSLRSKPLHTGFLQHQVSSLPAMGGDAGIRVMLVSQVVRAAVLSFVRNPFSSLIGQFAIEPPDA